MTNKTKLVWRLKEQPTADSLAQLVSVGIISKEDAKEILCSSETEEDRDKESLKAEIKFLREIVEKLSDNKGQIVATIREVETPYWKKYDWYNPYIHWCGGTLTLTSGDATYYSIDSTSTTLTTSSNFSDINTF
jgi:hypothetical protein